MATALPQGPNSLLVCTLCKKELENPRLLECQHSFCSKCLEQKVASLPSGEQLSCPSCDTIVPINGDNVDSLPENYVFNIIKESAGSSKDILNCVSCLIVKTKTFATHRCLDCGDTLCTTCKDWHCRSSALKHHVVIPFEEMKEQHYKEEWARRKQKKCMEHESPLKFYCDDCACLVCNDCVIFEHKLHAYETRNEASKKYRPDLEENVEKTFRTHNIHRWRVSQAKFLQEEIKQEHQKQQNDIYRVATEIHDLLDKVKEEKLTELEKHVNRETEHRDKIVQQEVNLEREATTTKTLAEGFLEHSTDVDFLEYRKDVERRIDRYKEIEMKTYPVLRLAVYKKGYNKAASTLGKLFGEMAWRSETAHLERKLGKPKECFKVQSERGRVNGLAVDSKGDILATSGSRIHVFTSEGKLKGLIECGALVKPWDILVRSQNIYVTDYAKNERKVIVMNSAGKVNKIVRLPDEEQKLKGAMCLTLYQKDRIVVSSFASDTIYISDPKCETFIPYIKKQHHTDMISPLYLCTTIEGDLISRKIAPRVVEAYDVDKELKWQFGGQDENKMGFASGLCSDEYGNVYIADFENPKIHIVKNGVPVGCIELGEEVKEIRPLAITKDDDLIYAYGDSIVKISFWE